VLFFKQILDHLSSKNSDVVIAVLEYSTTITLSTKKGGIASNRLAGLTPKFRYPTQIVQGTEALRFILGKGYKPSNVSDMLCLLHDKNMTICSLDRRWW